jgi:hypothetical protein
VGSYKELFLQMKPNLVAYLELVGNSVLIMVILVLSIGFLQNIMYLLAYVLNPFNEFSILFGLRLSMGRFCLSRWAQWLKTQDHLKRVVVGQAMEFLL